MQQRQPSHARDPKRGQQHADRRPKRKAQRHHHQVQNSDMTSLHPDLEEFAKEGNLQPSDVICGCRLGGNDHDKENPSSVNNEEEEEGNILLTILKIGLVNIMKVDPNDADIILKNFKSSGKKQQLVPSDKKIEIEPKHYDVQLMTDHNNDLRELSKRHFGKGPKNFKKELDKYATQHNLPQLQF
jgi:hypothetical protein